MKLEILDVSRVSLLKELNNFPLIKDFYLAGGTGLSLMFGYRESYDFDFFCENEFDPEYLLFQLKDYLKKHTIEVILIKKNFSSLDLIVDGIQLSFFQYNYHLISKTFRDDLLNNIQIASLEDIACMKASAINQRGSKKDFFDLYHIFKEANLDEKSFIKILTKKFNDKNFLVSLLYALSFFDDAESEKLPKTFVSFSWDEIKKFFLNLSIKMFREIIQ